jgi:dTDP-glucose pyrophosphorylase/CBS domain-containing protein
MVDMKVSIDSVSITINSSIRDAIACIDGNGCGIALVVDGSQHLVGTVTDGDIRRTILARLDINAPIGVLLGQKANSQYAEPITAVTGTSRDELLALMQRYVLRHIPILDEEGRVIDLILLDDLVPVEDLNIQAVIMAGGLGIRLRPLTENLPKPMLPLDGKPLLVRIIEQLRQVGIHRIDVTTHYKPEKITEYFGDGSAYGVELKYVNEEQPLGTGGALGLIPKPEHSLLVINGDVLTDVNFRSMYHFHQENKSDLTMAVRQYDVEVPYGVVDVESAHVKSISEKPTMKFFVNAGVYLIEPSVYQYIPTDVGFNMTDLIQWLLEAGRSVVSFPVREYWLDIGQRSDYVRAQVDIKNGLVTNAHEHNLNPPKTSDPEAK